MEYVSIRDGEADNFLFCNSYGQRLDENSCKHTINSYNKRRGVCKTSLHLFRHTFAKNWILNGGDIFRLQKILGHSSIETVREYVNMFSNDLKRDFDSFNPVKGYIPFLILTGLLLKELRKYGKKRFEEFYRVKRGSGRYLL